MINSSKYGYTIDLHGMRLEEARKYLTMRVTSAPKGTRMISVIHGFNGGTSLQQMVRHFHHDRIERIEIGLNNGETTIYLKK